MAGFADDSKFAHSGYLRSDFNDFEFSLGAGEESRRIWAVDYFHVAPLCQFRRRFGEIVTAQAERRCNASRVLNADQKALRLAFLKPDP